MTDFNQYIGVEYDPLNFNCWHFFQLIQKNHFNQDLPDFSICGRNLRLVAKTFDQAAERQNWVKIEEPIHGCGVLMRRAKNPIHIGIWLDVDGGGVLHNLQKFGVVFQKPSLMAGLVVEGYYKCKN